MDHRKTEGRNRGKPPVVPPAILRRDLPHGSSGGIIFRRFVWNVKAQRYLDAHDYGFKAWPIGKSR